MVTPHFPPYPYLRSWQPLFYFLSLWICIFWTFPVKGIIQYVIFCDWLHSFSIFSRYIHVVGWLRTLLLFIAEKYTFIISWMFGLFLLFGYYESLLLWTFVYTFLCGCLFSFLFGILGHMETVFNFLRNCQNCFSVLYYFTNSKVCYFMFTSAVYEGSNFSTSSLIPPVDHLLTYTHSGGYEVVSCVYFYCGKIYIT